jgi:Sec-independent protein translocase protein TatA
MISDIEWLFIALIVILLILWSPQTIPRFARALAEARREYEKASSTVQELVKEFESETEKAAQQDEQNIERDIIEKAKNLGIETYGKTREELLIAMFKKSVEKKERAGEEEAQPSESKAPESEVDQNSLNNETMPPRPDKS